MTAEKVIIPENLNDAVTVLADLGSSAQMVAGATWIMRSATRGEARKDHFISLQNIKEIQCLETSESHLKIGAMVTHEQLAHRVRTIPELSALHIAASSSANPAVRSMATVGGNICCHDFPSSDLVPALIAADAMVHFYAKSGTQSLPIEQFIAENAVSDHQEIVTHIEVPIGTYFSAHQRLLMRKAGEYPVVNASVRLTLNSTNIIEEARIAVGSVEARPKRWNSLEEAVTGIDLQVGNFKQMANAYLSDFTGRDGADAPGWYRTRVLPSVIAKLFADISAQRGGAL